MPTSQSDHYVYTVTEWSKPPFTNYLQTIFSDPSVTHFVDIGANVGGVIDVLHRLGYTRQLRTLSCFEPDPDNYQFLTKVVEKVHHESGVEVTCYPFGIYYGKTEMVVCGAGDNNVGGYFLADEAITSTRPFPVVPYEKTFRLDTLENHLKTPIDAIKIDIEGGELNILAHSTLLKQCKYMLLEWHFTPEHFERFFAEHLQDYYSILSYDTHINQYLLKNKKV